MLVSKYRHKLFVSLEIKSYCELALWETAFKAGCEVFVLQVGDDHLYIFVGLYLSCSVSVLISLLKCNSVSRLFLAFLELKGKLWKGHLWSRGKFYRSIGQVNGGTIKYYIEKSKHQ